MTAIFRLASRRASELQCNHQWIRSVALRTETVGVGYEVGISRTALQIKGVNELRRWRSATIQSELRRELADIRSDLLHGGESAHRAPERIGANLTKVRRNPGERNRFSLLQVRAR